MAFLQAQDISTAVSSAIVSNSSILAALSWGDIIQQYWEQYVPMENQFTGKVLYAFAMLVVSIWFQKSPPLAGSFPTISAFAVGASAVLTGAAARDVLKHYFEKWVPMQSKVMYAVVLTVIALALQQWM